MNSCFLLLSTQGIFAQEPCLGAKSYLLHRSENNDFIALWEQADTGFLKAFWTFMDIHLRSESPAVQQPCTETSTELDMLMIELESGCWLSPVRLSQRQLRIRGQGPQASTPARAAGQPGQPAAAWLCPAQHNELGKSVRFGEVICV